METHLQVMVLGLFTLKWIPKKVQLLPLHRLVTSAGLQI
jgi:hypothetical protein